MFALWPVLPNASSNNPLTAEYMRQAQAAIVCAIRIQKELAGITMHSSEINLSLRIGMSCGVIDVLNVGGVENKWIQLVFGDCLDDMNSAERLAHPGQVVVARSLMKHITLAGMLNAAEMPDHKNFFLVSSRPILHAVGSHPADEVPNQETR